MKLHPLWPALAVVAGCGLVNSNTLSYQYSFDPQQFMQKLGDEKSMTTVPMQTCDPAAATDQCSQLQASLPSGTPAKLSCDATTRMCAAVVDVVLPYPIDLSQEMTPLPSPVVQYGIDHVTIEKIAYWIMTNTVNVDLPPIELYVAASAAKDQNDASAKLVGTVAKLPARSGACADAADGDKDEPSNGAPVCDIKLDEAGQAVLAAFIKNYKTPFQFIAHTKIVAHGGDPVPVGTIAFFVRPTVQFSVLK
jgi:hypothetical protein